MIRVFVGFRCNNRCGFCAQADLAEHATDPDVDGALRAVTDGSVVAFIGGEPTLFEALPGWIATARRQGARDVVVQTNGRRLAEPGYARALITAGAARFEVALQGSNAKMHDFHTTIVGSFARTGAGIRRAKGEGATVSTTTVVTRANYRHLSEIVELARALGAARAAFRLTLPLGRAAGAIPPLVPPKELAAPYLSRAVARGKQLGFACLIATDATEAADATDEHVGLGRVAPFGV